MKLVLLPGLDGTGDLFSPLLQELSEYKCEIIPLPSSGAQDYKTLTDYVLGELPDDDFVLVAESFSGPIGMNISRVGLTNLKGVIFVATFLSPPNSKLIALAKILPLKLLSVLPAAKTAYKLLFLGSKASDTLTQQFQSTIHDLPASLIKARLSSIQSLSFDNKLYTLPAGYIQAVSDKLVPAAKAREFYDCFGNITIKIVEGPHFILQANPVECAEAIIEMACDFYDSNHPAGTPVLC